MMDADTVVLEGFLCPMCKKNLNSVYQLHAHFEDTHGGDDKFGGQLRDFLGKAKRKILRKKDDFDFEDGYTRTSNTINTGEGGSGGTDPFTWDAELGASRSHIHYFKMVRGSRINHIDIETNKLLIRLEKLVKFYDKESEKSKKKAFEKCTVPWAPDAGVKFCSTCRGKFNLTNRKHHCRLCGCIICKECSGFLVDEFCAKVVKFKTSSGSKKKEDQEESGMRVCRECEKMITRTYEQNQESETKLPIVQLYEKLSTVKQQILSETPTYNVIADSLNSGEMDHDLAYANEVRAQLLKLFDIMDLISKKILTLGLKDDKPLPMRFQNLQRKIRMYATQFMQEQMLLLPSLPMEDELVFLHEQRQIAIAQRVAQEKQEALESQRLEQERQEKGRTLQLKGHQRNTSWPSMAWTKGAESPKVKTPERDRSSSNIATNEDKGWKPQVLNQATLAEEEDPLQQQITIIKSFLQQARKAGKMDEVKMLEENLKDLQKEQHLRTI